MTNHPQSSNCFIKSPNPWPETQQHGSRKPGAHQSLYQNRDASVPKEAVAWFCGANHGASNMLPGYSVSDDEEAPEDEDAPEDEEAPEDEQEAPPEPIDWLGLRRREPSSKRGARPNQFYGIFVDEETGHLHSVGEALDDHVDRHKVKVPKGTVAIWPLDSKKRETLWGLTPDQLRANWAKGYARVYNWKPAKKTGTVQYLTTGTIEKIGSGQVTIITPGRRRWRGCPGRRTRPPTLWSAHSARPWSATPMRTAPGSSHRQQRAP